MDLVITASSIMDRAILLKDGGAIAIPCSSYEEMESLRIRLYKLRNRLEKRYKFLARTLDIVRKTGEDKWTLYITKERTIPGVLIIEDGEARPFVINETKEERTEEEKERLTAANEIDSLNLTDTEHQEQKERTGNFDEAASKIEAAQGLAEEKDQEKSKSDVS